MLGAVRHVLRAAGAGITVAGGLLLVLVFWLREGIGARPSNGPWLPIAAGLVLLFLVHPAYRRRVHRYGLIAVAVGCAIGAVVAWRAIPASGTGVGLLYPVTVVGLALAALGIAALTGRPSTVDTRAGGRRSRRDRRTVGPAGQSIYGMS
jgi:hypothetical protein